MLFAGEVEDAHAAIVGGEVVQATYELGGVGNLLSGGDALPVTADGLLEKTVVAVVFSQRALAHGDAEHVLRLLIGCDDAFQAVGVVVGVYDAIDIMVVGIAGSGCWLPLTRGAEESCYADGEQVFCVDQCARHNVALLVLRRLFCNFFTKVVKVAE